MKGNFCTKKNWLTFFALFALLNATDAYCTSNGPVWITKLWVTGDNDPVAPNSFLITVQGKDFGDGVSWTPTNQNGVNCPLGLIGMPLNTNANKAMYEALSLLQGAGQWVYVMIENGASPSAPCVLDLIEVSDRSGKTSATYPSPNSVSGIPYFRILGSTSMSSYALQANNFYINLGLAGSPPNNACGTYRELVAPLDGPGNIAILDIVLSAYISGKSVTANFVDTNNPWLCTLTQINFN